MRLIKGCNIHGHNWRRQTIMVSRSLHNKSPQNREMTRFTAATHISRHKCVSSGNIYGNSYCKSSFDNRESPPYQILSKAMFCSTVGFTLCIEHVDFAPRDPNCLGQDYNGSRNPLLAFKLLLQYTLFPAAFCLEKLPVTYCVNSRWTNMGTTRRWKYSDRANTKYLQKVLSQCHYVANKYHLRSKLAFLDEKLATYYTVVSQHFSEAMGNFAKLLLSDRNYGGSPNPNSQTRYYYSGT